jgi:hypothetical protein
MIATMAMIASAATVIALAMVAARLFASASAGHASTAGLSLLPNGLTGTSPVGKLPMWVE